MLLFLKSFQYAFRGIVYCIKNERNMRIHTVAALYVSVFARFFALSRAEYALLLLTFGAVMAAEAINTAIEILCNKVSMKRSHRIRVAKDSAAGAVLITAIFAVFIALFLFGDAGCWQELFEFYFTHPVNLILLIVSMVLSVVYIILGPGGISGLFRKKSEQDKTEDAQKEKNSVRGRLMKRKTEEKK